MEKSIKSDKEEKQVLIEIVLNNLEPSVMRALKDSLVPEVLSQPDRKRGVVYIEDDNSTLKIKIHSQSVSGARALFNAYIYLLNSALRTINISR